MQLHLTSSAFVHGGPIPAQYTCDGDDVSPPLAWTGVPHGAKSLALIVDDPDAPDPNAPKRTWVHWVLYACRRRTARCRPVSRPINSAGAHRDQRLAAGRYGGPCPPIGRHRYFFKLFALDAVLPDWARPQVKVEGEMGAFWKTELVDLPAAEDVGLRFDRGQVHFIRTGMRWRNDRAGSGGQPWCRVPWDSCGLLRGVTTFWRPILCHFFHSAGLKRPEAINLCSGGTKSDICDPGSANHTRRIGLSPPNIWTTERNSI